MTDLRPRCAAGFAAATLLSATLTAQTPSPQDPIPIPTGRTDRPGEIFDAREHSNVHSSLPFQGNPASVKYAPVMYTTQPGALADWETTIIVNNPDDQNDLIIDIEIFECDPANPSAPAVITDGASATIPPNGSWIHRAVLSLGNMGMVRVQADPSSNVQQFVGSTIYYADDAFANPFGGVPDKLPLLNFMSSMQPLQELQAEKDLVAFGPFPAHTFSMNSPVDIANDLYGFINVCNPYPTAQTVRIFLASSSGYVGTPIDVPICGYGAIQDISAFLRARDVYFQGLGDEEITVYVRSLDGRDILGDAVLVDLATNNEGEFGIPGTRARMTSFMPGYTPNTLLVNPELVVQADEATTIMGIANFERTPTGPVTVQYFDQNGAQIGIDTLASLNTFGGYVLGLGMAASPNFPTQAFAGSVRISCAGGGLIGWTNRGSEAVLNNRMYGESLHGTAGREHRRGVRVNNQRRAIISLAFDNGDPRQPTPGYATFVNDLAPNIGSYSFDFFHGHFFQPMLNGSPVGSQTFAGLPAMRTSFSYEDPIITPGGNLFDSGRVRVTNRGVKGISTIGGSLVARELVSGQVIYPGPGDTVPPAN